MTNKDLEKTEQWQQVKKSFLSSHPYCYICGNKNAVMTKHIKPPAGDKDLFFNELNLAAYCKKCFYITQNRQKDNKS